MGEKVKDYLLFPFKALISLAYCLWGGLRDWRMVLIAQWRYLDILHGKGSTITMEQWLWERDQESEMPELWDSISFWEELWGVVVRSEVWDDNALRLDVRVTCSPSQRYLRPHEIDKIVRRGKDD